MPTPNLVRRGLTWFVRYQVPEDRWADVGRALGSSSGIRRDVTRTLGTRDFAEARAARDVALSAIRSEIDRALEAIGKRPLTDWTATWETRAISYREELAAARSRDAASRHDPNEDSSWTDPRDLPDTHEDLTTDALIEEAKELARKRGDAAGTAFLEIARGSGLTVAQGLAAWLDTERGRVKGNTIASHEAAFKKLAAYLKTREGRPSLHAMPITGLSRRTAGEFIQQRREQGAAAETIQREASAFNGLWRWAIRRGYAEVNPWSDQTAGLKAGREPNRTSPGGRERAYTADELCKLLRAGKDELAPGRGGYGATLWDAFRLLLLTGCRASELMELKIRDVIADGTAIVVAAEGGKSEAASRIVPLHEHAQAVIRMRLASVPTADPAAPLWPELPPTGRDLRRAKGFITRYPEIRRRLLGPSDEVDLHSFRRTFLTAAETAMHRGGRLNAELIALLVGHRREGLAFSLYSDWARLGQRRDVEGVLAERLGTLRAAVDDVVGLGFDRFTQVALVETHSSRPKVARIAPAFRRA